VSKNVCIVESPAKIASVTKYLGKDFTVLASYGHIRDLPSKNGSVDPDNNFSMVWDFGDRGQKTLTAIAKAVKQADTLYLATDPDREGEAISWHVLDALNVKGALKGKTIKRIVFNEITKNAVQAAVAKPREIDQQLVDAYLTRRALDYLVGFNLSPVLWRKLPGARSAGRVQSVALRLIVERDAEIEQFNPQEYWTIDGQFLNIKDKKYSARLTHLDGKKLTKFDLSNENISQAAVKTALDQNYSVSKVVKKKTKRNPTPPFITSTMQQEAARKLGFGAKRTMQTAQKLYEGFTIDGENVGLITYMRTDSVNLSNDALTNLRSFIERVYGNDYLPSDPRFYKSKVKNAQEAHEAIRPTDISRTPKEMERYLDEGQLKLYTLIWKRAIACQMESATFDSVAVDITSQDKKIAFRASGSTMVFDGFLKVYQEGKDEGDEEDDEKLLPPLAEGEVAKVNSITPDQHFTQPPPRFSEASLVKKLEELGIGRPSTYASIIGVLQERDYVKLDKKQFKAEDRGRIVISFLKNHFTQYVSYDFTANLEEELDDISNGSLDWLKVMTTFWKGFNSTVTKAMELTTTEVIYEIEEDLAFYLFKGQTKEERVCPSCKKGTVNLKLSKFGAFLGCSLYPECNYTKRLVEGEGEEAEASAQTFEPQLLGNDPQTDQTIQLKKGPYGFYAEWSLIEKQKKPKRVSMPKHLTPETFTLDAVLELGALPKVIGEHEAYGTIKIGIGRFGPYVQYSDGFVSIPKAEEPMTLPYDRAIELVVAKIAKGPSKRGGFKKKAPIAKKKVTTAKKSK